MSIKELKQVLFDAKVPIPPGIEKPELIRMAELVLHSKPMPSKLFPRTRTFGAPLNNCSAIFVFFHGYGASEEQFLFLEDQVDPRVAVVCPKSPADGRFRSQLSSNLHSWVLTRLLTGW